MSKSAKWLIYYGLHFLPIIAGFFFFSLSFEKIDKNQ